MKGFFGVLFSVMTLSGSAQMFVVEKSVITFFSAAAIEDITAENSTASAIFNATSGEIAFSVPINQFQFDKKLMQEHFNEKYMESDKYPSSTFSGKLIGYEESSGTSQQISAKGKLTIHGVTREVVIPGTIESKEEKVILSSKFIVRLKDYRVKIPQLLWQNIAEQVEVTVNFTLKAQ